MAHHRQMRPQPAMHMVTFQPKLNILSHLHLDMGADVYIYILKHTEHVPPPPLMMLTVNYFNALHFVLPMAVRPVGKCLQCHLKKYFPIPWSIHYINISYFSVNKVSLFNEITQYPHVICGRRMVS